MEFFMFAKKCVDHEPDNESSDDVEQKGKE